MEKIANNKNKTESKHTTEKINKDKSRFFEKANKINKCLARNDQEKEKSQMTQIRRLSSWPGTSKTTIKEMIDTLTSLKVGNSIQ